MRSRRGHEMLISAGPYRCVVWSTASLLRASIVLPAVIAAACGSNRHSMFIEDEGLGFGLHRAHIANGDDDILDASAFGEQDVLERLAFSANLQVGGLLPWAPVQNRASTMRSFPP